METSYTVRDLEACQVYIMAVMIAGPIGFGPATGFQVISFFFFHLLVNLRQ